MALRLITAGESHGPGLTCIVEGLPAGLELDREAIDRDMARRQLGHGRGGRMKIERDTRRGDRRRAPRAHARLARSRCRSSTATSRTGRSGWTRGRSRPTWPRSTCRARATPTWPGCGSIGFTDVRNVLERASARETAARVAGGALCKAFLRALGVEVRSHVVQVGDVLRPPPRRPADARELRRRRRRPGAHASTRRRARRWSRTSTSSGRPTSRSAAPSRSWPSASCPGSART